MKADTARSAGSSARGRGTYTPVACNFCRIRYGGFVHLSSRHILTFAPGKLNVTAKDLPVVPVHLPDMMYVGQVFSSRAMTHSRSRVTVLLGGGGRQKAQCYTICRIAEKAY